MRKQIFQISGVQMFKELHRDYGGYVDKTQHIYNFASRHKVILLLRSRRFGKSLLCSTIASLFRNEREYFKDAICDTDWEWKEHPIIYLDMSGEDFTTNDGADALISAINEQLDGVYENYGISVENSKFIGVRFSCIIKERSQKRTKSLSLSTNMIRRF